MLPRALLVALLVVCATVGEKLKEASVDDGPKYSVQLLTGALPPARRPGKQNSIVMTKTDGRKFRCYLPSSKNATEAKDESDAAPAPHVGTYLQPLMGNCFYRLEGWWTYEFCFPKSIRQFHQEKVKSSGQPDITT
eukprot:3502271-Prymnesium_polylepis.1